MCGRIKHHNSRRLQIVAVDHIVRIPIFTISLARNLGFQAVNDKENALRLKTHFRCLVEPRATLFRVLHGKSFQLGIDGIVAFRHGLVGSGQAVVNLRESVEHITRHIQCKHGSQNDVHQIDHLLARRQACIGLSHFLLSSVSS